MPSSVKVWEISKGLSDKIGLLRRPKKRSSLRPILRESVFPEDLIGSKSSFKTYSLVDYALKKTYFKGWEKISLELDLFSSLLRRPILSDSPQKPGGNLCSGVRCFCPTECCIDAGHIMGGLLNGKVKYSCVTYVVHILWGLCLTDKSG